MDLKFEFATFSVVVGALAALPYIYAIIKGHRPPYSTYLGWLFIGSTGFVFHYQTIGAGDYKWSAFLPALYILIPLTYLLLLVFLKAKWEMDARDKTCLGGVAVCWIVWVASHFAGLSNPAVPILALVATDAFASWPLLQDASRGEESKPMNVVAWSLAFVSVAAGVFAVADFRSAEIIYPGYLFLLMGSIWVFSLFNFLQERKASVGK